MKEEFFDESEGSRKNEAQASSSRRSEVVLQQITKQEDEDKPVYNTRSRGNKLPTTTKPKSIIRNSRSTTEPSLISSTISSKIDRSTRVYGRRTTSKVQTSKIPSTTRKPVATTTATTTTRKPVSTTTATITTRKSLSIKPKIGRINTTHRKPLKQKSPAALEADLADENYPEHFKVLLKSKIVPDVVVEPKKLTVAQQQPRSKPTSTTTTTTTTTKSPSFMNFKRFVSTQKPVLQEQQFLTDERKPTITTYRPRQQPTTYSNPMRFVTTEKPISEELNFIPLPKQNFRYSSKLAAPVSNVFKNANVKSASDFPLNHQMTYTDRGLEKQVGAPYESYQGNTSPRTVVSFFFYYLIYFTDFCEIFFWDWFLLELVVRYKKWCVICHPINYNKK